MQITQLTRKNVCSHGLNVVEVGGVSVSDDFMSFQIVYILSITVVIIPVEVRVV